MGRTLELAAWTRLFSGLMTPFSTNTTETAVNHLPASGRSSWLDLNSWEILPGPFVGLNAPNSRNLPGTRHHGPPAGLRVFLYSLIVGEVGKKKKNKLQIRHIWVQIVTLPTARYVSVSKLYYSPNTQFSHLQNGVHSYLLRTRCIDCKASLNIIILGGDGSASALQSSVCSDAGGIFILLHFHSLSDIISLRISVLSFNKVCSLVHITWPLHMIPSPLTWG